MEPKTLDSEPLVAGRECGACDVCCVALTIDDPELQKLQGYRCRHLAPDRGCGIYDARPHTCRKFYCGWRRLKWVKSPLRPDLSGVLVRPFFGRPAGGGEDRVGIIVSLLRRSALKAEGLAETIAAAVNAGLPVWLHIPGPPGYSAGVGRIDEVVLDLVLARDKAGLLAVVREAYRNGKAGKFRPLRLVGPAETDEENAEERAAEKAAEEAAGG